MPIEDTAAERIQRITNRTLTTGEHLREQRREMSEAASLRIVLSREQISTIAARLTMQASELMECWRHLEIIAGDSGVDLPTGTEMRKVSDATSRKLMFDAIERLGAKTERQPGRDG